MNKLLYLKPNVRSEALINHWYATPLLVAPATAALMIIKLHVKIMQSYVAIPEIHEEALNLPEMRGGAFIFYEQRQVEAINNLLQEFINNNKKLFAFVSAIDQLTAQLNTQLGFTLENLYASIPAELKGYVELIYDRNYHASFRLIEPLLYKSDYYLKEAQQVVLSVATGDHRICNLTTPRLSQPDNLFIQLPFASKFYDELFSMRRVPRTFNQIKYLFRQVTKDAIDENLLLSFFTEIPSHNNSKDKIKDKLRIRYYGHACLLIESPAVKILVDPIISYYHDNSLPRYTYVTLPEKIDYVLITHAHHDHFLIEHLLQLRNQVDSIIIPKNNSGVLIDPSLKLILKNIGYKNIIEIDEMDEIKINGGSITGIPFLGEHGDLNIHSKIAYAIKQDDKTILCAADLNNLDGIVYKHVHNIVGDVDTLFISLECEGAPISWLYGPLMPTPPSYEIDQSRRLTASDYQKAMAIIQQFNCKQAYIYAMGQEPWLNHILTVENQVDSLAIAEANKLIAECQGNGIAAERLFISKEIILN